MLRSKSRSSYLEFGQKKHTSFLVRSISGSKLCRGDALASQVDKQALVSVDRHSVSLSENRIVKAAMMQKQVSDLEEELKNTKARLEEVETERNRAVAEVREAKELANAGLSPQKAEQMFSELKSLQELLSNSKKEIKLRDEEINELSKRLESAKVFEAKLADRDASLEQFKKQIRELENELEKTKKSESHMLESLMLQTRQFEQTKMDLEESKLDVVTLQEKLNSLQNGGKNGFNQTSNLDSSSNAKILRDEIAMLRKEVKLATEAEETSKKAMDDLASALSEVAMESSTANERLRLSEEQVAHLKKEIERLREELELQTETSERLRVESEEQVLAWTAKEMGFISYIKNADEDNASLKQENHKLNEALVAAENATRIAREEGLKLRDILKEALNESSVAKEAANIARAENSELKDLLAKKEERLRINEDATHENAKGFNSPDSMLYEDHLDGRTTPPQIFNFDEFKAFSKNDDNVAEFVVDDDPEKAEVLKGSIFDTSASPRSELHTLESKGQQQRVATGFADLGGSGQFEEVEHSVNGGTNGHHHHHHHTEDGDDKGSYMSGLYNRKKLFRKIGELIIGKNNKKKEGSLEQGKENAKEQGKEMAEEQLNNFKEWNIVLQEARFMEVDAAITNVRPLWYCFMFDSYPNSLQYVARLNASKVLKLQGALLTSELSP
ncbi:hypothetical protein HanOQP8_Chr14g0534621 [Helianthus annuus]|nr:hypothetical protein HanOQP8_Chr14g0534621 [Helianthus annuus]